MEIFDSYAEYYNLLYKDKNYTIEADYIDRIIKKYSPETIDILNLGCGTGKHDFLLAEKGYILHGVDISPEMVNIANSQLAKSNMSNLSFSVSDIRDLNLNKTFDTICSLFHVMSYQTSNEDLDLVLQGVKRYLKKGGIFIFDFWYGPAVIAEKPENRVKRLENENIEVVRIAEPDIHPNRNVVDVNYHLFIKNKRTELVREVREKHPMRYFFTPELEYILKINGFKVLNKFEWLSENELTFNSWNAFFVATI